MKITDKQTLFLRRLVVLASAIVCCAALFICCNHSSDKQLDSVEKMYDFILPKGSFPEMIKADDEIVSEVYGVDLQRISAHAVGTAENKLNADEIVIFELSDEGYADDLIRILNSRLDSLARAAENYNPSQYEMIKSAVVKEKGRFVFLIINKDSARLSQLLWDSAVSK